MSIITIGKHILDIDLKSTQAAYEHIDFESYKCNCDGCRNYYSYADKFEDDIKLFFKQLGINDMKNCTEVWMCYKDDEKNIAHYNGWFHVCGKIIKGADFWNDKLTSYECTEELKDNFKVGFTKSLSLVEEEFGDECIQIEFFADIPWVID